MSQQTCPIAFTTGVQPAWWRWAALGLLLIAAASFLQRAVVRPEPHRMDFHFLSNATRLWLAGGNPYDPAQIQQQWVASGAAHSMGPLGDQIVVYPPTAFPLLAPFALLSPAASAWAWLIVELLCLGLLIRSAAQMNRVGRGLPLLLLVALSLAWWPIRMAVYHGQPALPAVALAFAAYALSERGRHWTAGLLLGIAAALKPHLVAPIAAMLLLPMRWKPLLLCVLIWAAAGAIGAAQLHQSGWSAWFADWRANLALTNAPGNTSDISVANGLRFDMTQLQVPLYSLWPSHTWANTASLAICLIGAGLLAWLYIARAARDQVLLLGALCALSLMVIYHRTPDAALLLPAAAVAFRPGLTPRLRLTVLLLFLPLTVPADMRNTLAAWWPESHAWRFARDAFNAAAMTLAFAGMLLLLGRTGQMRLSPATDQ